MIKFFRKIRQNLLMENKTGKYFKYAIGEIILVVIGILIALQINNWNEQRKTQGNQEKYLNLLKSESLNNLREVSKFKERVTDMNSWQKTVFNLIDANHDTISESYLSKVFFNAFAFKYNFNYENSTLFELKNSGELKNMKNDSLRKYLIALEPLVLKVKDQEQDVEKKNTAINEYLTTQGTQRRIYEENGLMPTSKSKGSNIHILKQDEFENRLLLYTAYNVYLIETHYPKLEEHLKKIIEIIEKELNKK